MKQTVMVMDYLRKHPSITQQEAYEHFGITRLSAVIWKLRHKNGFIICDELVEGKNRFGMKVYYKRYYLP